VSPYSLNQTSLKMARFSDLPIELYLEILSYLEESKKTFWLADYTDILSLCRTSKSLYHIATTVLYSKIKISPKMTWQDKDEVSLDARTRYLLRTLKENPVLAAHTRQLTANPWATKSKTAKSFEYSMADDFRRTYFLSTTAISMIEDLLTAFTSVRHLNFKVDSDMYWPIFFHCLGSMKNLENLELRSIYGIRHSVLVKALLPLRKLRSLKLEWYTEVNLEIDLENPSALDYDQLTLTSLQIDGNADGFSELTSICPDLESLRLSEPIHLGTNELIDGRYDTLQDTLPLCKTRLKTLYLCLHEPRGEDDLDYTFNPRSDLRRVKLRNLNISQLVALKDVTICHWWVRDNDDAATICRCLLSVPYDKFNWENNTSIPFDGCLSLNQIANVREAFAIAHDLGNSPRDVRLIVEGCAPFSEVRKDGAAVCSQQLSKLHKDLINRNNGKVDVRISLRDEDMLSLLD
jgi:hypothetical protein